MFPRGSDGRNDNILAQIRDAVLKATPARAVYLLGSRARGDARPDSDYDILVVTEDVRPASEIRAAIRLQLIDLHIPLDILLFTPDGFEWRKDIVNTLPRAACKEGILLYG